MAKIIYTYPAMRDFTCLGDECEDTCCQSWDIRVDKYHYDMLRECVSDNESRKTLFEKYITRLADGDDRNYALINLDDQGMCPFLDSKGWCDLHKNYGVDPLSNVCAFYPRVISQYIDRFEMSGALSCPEVARRTLLGDSDFRQVEMEPENLPRANNFPITRCISDVENEPYLAHFLDVREAFLALVANEAYPFESRLFALSSLANNLSTFYYEDCQSVNSNALKKELDRSLESDSLDKLQSYIDQYQQDVPLAVIVVQAILRLRLQQFPNDTLSELIAEIFSLYESQLEGSPELYGGNIPPDALWHVYRENAAILEEKYPVLIEQVFSRYLQNCLYREWFISMPSPFVYMHMLTIRVATLKFLLMSHPKIVSLLKADTTVADEEEKIQQYIIDVFYKYSRAIDHNMNFLQVVYNAIAEQEMMHFDYALPFIKF